MKLNETFYRYTMHQQSQDPSPFPWPTPESFEATVEWPGDEPDLERGAGLVGALGGEDGAQEDDDMAEVLEYFM